MKFRIIRTVLTNKYHTLLVEKYKKNCRDCAQIYDILKKENRDCYTFTNPDDEDRVYYYKPKLLQKLYKLEQENKEIKRKIKEINRAWQRFVNDSGILNEIKFFKDYCKNV